MESKKIKPRFVHITKPTCPACGESDVKAMQGAKPVGDGVLHRQSKCNVCDYAFVVVIEPSRDYA